MPRRGIPIVNRGQIGSGELQLGKPEQAVGQDNGVLGCILGTWSAGPWLLGVGEHTVAVLEDGVGVCDFSAESLDPHVLETFGALAVASPGACTGRVGVCSIRRLVAEGADQQEAAGSGRGRQRGYHLVAVGRCRAQEQSSPYFLTPVSLALTDC